MNDALSDAIKRAADKVGPCDIHLQIEVVLGPPADAPQPAEYESCYCGYVYVIPGAGWIAAVDRAHGYSRTAGYRDITKVVAGWPRAIDRAVNELHRPDKSEEPSA